MQWRTLRWIGMTWKQFPVALFQLVELQSVWKWLPRRSRNLLWSTTTTNCRLTVAATMETVSTFPVHHLFMLCHMIQTRLHQCTIIKVCSTIFTLGMVVLLKLQVRWHCCHLQLSSSYGLTSRINMD